MPRRKDNILYCVTDCGRWERYRENCQNAFGICRYHIDKIDKGRLERQGWANGECYCVATESMAFRRFAKEALFHE